MIALRNNPRADRAPNAAFVLLRLPPLLASKVPSRTPNDALRFGVTESFYIAAIIPACVGITLLFVLRRRGEAMWSFVGHRDKAPGFKFAEGLKLGFKDADLGLAFISSFAVGLLYRLHLLFHH